MNLCCISAIGSFDFEPNIDCAVIKKYVIKGSFISCDFERSASTLFVLLEKESPTNARDFSVCLPKQTSCLGKHTRMLQRRRPAGSTAHQQPNGINVLYTTADRFRTAAESPIEAVQMNTVPTLVRV